MNNAKQYAAGAENLKKNVANYIENKDNISDSTPPEVIDFYDTMDKAADSISVQDVEGVPTFTGVTLGGKPISIPVSDIASGANTMRFNTKVDIQAEFKPTLDAVAKIKTDMETKFGVGTGNLPFSNPAVQQKVNFTLDKLVNNNSKLRAIAADIYGYDHQAFEEATDEPGELDAFKAEMKAEMMGDFERSYFPTEKTTKYDAPYGSGSQNLTAGQNLNEQKRQREQQLIGESIDKGFANDFSNFYHKDITSIDVDKKNAFGFDRDNPLYTVKLKNGDTKDDLTKEQAQQLLTQVTGYQGGSSQGQGRQDVVAKDWLKNRGGGSPTKRSPLNRSPLQERPPTKEELKALEKEGAASGIIGYDEYRRDERDNKNIVSRGFDSLSDSAYDADFDGLGNILNDFSYLSQSDRYTDEKLKKLHVPGTAPTSDEERATIYDDAYETLSNNFPKKEIMAIAKKRGLTGSFTDIKAQLSKKVAMRGANPNQKVDDVIGHDNPYRN